MPRVTKKDLEDEIKALRSKVPKDQVESDDEPIFKELPKPAPSRRGRPPKSAIPEQESKVKPTKAKAAPKAKAKRSNSKPATKRGAKIKEVVISPEEEESLGRIRFGADNDDQPNPDDYTPVDDSSQLVGINNDSREREKIKSQFMKLLSANPNLETKTPGKFKDIARDCGELPIDELRMRLQYAQKIQYDGLDNRIAGDVLAACSALVGGLLRCNDELQSRVKKDEYLQTITGQALHENVLHLIPNYAKIAGIYGSHVIGAFKDKKNSAQPAQITAEVEPEKKDEPAQDANIGGNIDGINPVWDPNNQSYNTSN